MGIGENIKKYRGSIKQADLAEKLGVTTTTVSRWENEQNTPNGEMLKKIAEALNTDISCLTQEISEPKIKELKELKEDRGMMIYRFNEKEALELPATVDFIPIFERIVSERLKMKIEN